MNGDGASHLASPRRDRTTVCYDILERGGELTGPRGQGQNERTESFIPRQMLAEPAWELLRADRTEDSRDR